MFFHLAGYGQLQLPALDCGRFCDAGKIQLMSDQERLSAVDLMPLPAHDFRALSRKREDIQGTEKKGDGDKDERETDWQEPKEKRSLTRGSRR